MNSLNILYFPGTEIYSIRQYPVFLLFHKIHLLKPVEENPPDSGEQSPDNFIKSGFCQAHTPCPLGANRDRFLRLVEDIRHRKDDYAAQLSSLILAGKSGSSSIDEDSEQAIINSLFTPEDLQAKARQTKKEDALWQARLVLAIGEILDQEEEEIARNLAMLADEQAGLFKALHGEIEDLEEDNPFAELSRLESNLGATNSGNLKKRFNGWKTLFLEGDIPECEIFLTANQDAGDLLLERYEQKTNLPAELAATLELPGLIGWNSSEAFQAVDTFSTQNGELLCKIHEALRDLSQKEAANPPAAATGSSLAALAGQWQAQLETAFPANTYGRTPVKCYHFPGITCAALIGKTPPANGEPKSGLLIVAD